MLHHFECNVRLVETSRGWWYQDVNKICFHRNEMILSGKVKMAESTFSFGLSQKVNGAQPKRFVKFMEELEEAGRKSSNETQKKIEH